MTYSDLTPAQLDQVNSMFLDDLFHTDPNGFDYETNRAGVISGRRPLQRREMGRLKKDARVTLHTVVLEGGEDNRHAVQHLARLALQHLEVTEVTA